MKRQKMTTMRITRSNQLARIVWGVVRVSLYRLSPVPMHGFRRFLLRRFGARIESGAHPYPKAKVWAPWNLIMERDACLADGVDCYNVALVKLGPGAVVSQRAFLCTASHDFRDVGFPLTAAPIEVGQGAWVAAESFVGPGVSIGDYAVVGARAVVMQSVDDDVVVAGNPAVAVGARGRAGLGVDVEVAPSNQS